MRISRPNPWLLLLLAGQLMLLLHASRHDSVTVDEFALLPAGLAKLQHGTDVFWLNPVNPPLVPMFQAIPAWLAGERIDRAAIGSERAEARWEIGMSFMRERPDRYHAIFAGARLVTMVFALATTLLMFSLMRILGAGERAAVGASALGAFCPNLIGHGHLATVDVAFTCFTLGVVVCIAQLTRPQQITQVTRRAGFAITVLLTLSLAGALLAKFTALLLVPLFLVLSLGAGRGGWKTFGTVTTAISIAILALLLFFRGEGVGRQMNTFPFESGAFLSLQTGALGNAPSPLPEWYWRGLDRELARVEQKRNVFYFRGAVTREKNPLYFAAAMLWKLPVSSLILIGCGCLFLFGWEVREDARRGRARRALFLMLPPLYLVSLFSAGIGSNLGIRYVLPAIPFLYGLGALALMAERKWTVWGAAALIGLSMLTTVRNAPDSLAYFNFLAGGSENGYKLLSDSNVDWGQDLPELARLQEERALPPVALSYFGLVDPALYGVRSRPLSTFDANVNGVIAVSVHHLNGITPFTRVDPAILARLRESEPFARAGASIHLYEWNVR